METTDAEQIIINNYKDKIACRTEKIKIIQSCIDLLKKEYNILIDENKDIEAKRLKKIINKHIRILAGSKGSITYSKKNISKIVCKNIYEYDKNLIMLIINKLHNAPLINMITSTKYFYQLFIDESEYNIIELYNKQYCLTYKIPKQLLNYYNIELEQLFYIPFTKEGRTLLHLFVRNNLICVMSYLLNKFPKLNINVKTTIDNWSPIHNTINMNLYEMTKLLINNGVDYNSNFTYDIHHKFNNIIDFVDYKSFLYKKITKNYTDYKLLHNYIVNNIDLHQEETYKTLINYNNINKEPYIMNILQEIFKQEIFKQEFNNMKINII